MFKPNIIVFLVMFLLVMNFDISEAKGGRGGGRGRSLGSSGGGGGSK